MADEPGRGGRGGPAEWERFIAPCPLVSRGKPRRVSEEAVVVNVGVGPARVFVRWALAAGAATGEAAPAAYRLETSASSRDGRDGDWRVERVVAGNTALGRGHDLEFDGQSWVRLVLGESELGTNAGRGREQGAARAEPLPAGAMRLELDVHDASNGTDDTWLVLGDELGRDGLLPLAGEPGFAELVHAEYPGYFPACFNEARAGEAPAQTLARLEDLLAVHARVRHVALVYAEAEPVALEPLVVALLQAGRTPCLARGWGAASRAAVADLEGRHELVPGPDLRAWFEAHPDQLGPGRRPTREGRRAIHRLWAEAMDVFYVPQ